MGKDNYLWIGLRALFLIFFLSFFFYPLLLILSKSLSIQAGSISGFISVLLEKKTLIWNSFYQASFSTLFSVLVGIPAAYLIARKEFPGKKIVKAVSLVPFVFPSILVVLAFVIILGNNGWLNSLLEGVFGFRIQFLYGFSGVILAHVFYNFPIVMRFVGNAWENLDATMKDAARTLGASRFQAFLRITLPQLLPSIIAAASLVFIFTFMSFAIVITLGGLQFSTLEVEIYRQVLRSLNLGVGALLALFQFLVLSAVAYLYFHLSEKYRITGQANPAPVSRISFSSARGIAEFSFLAFILVAVLLPIFSIAVFAFMEPGTGNLTLRSFEKLFFTSNVTLFGTNALDSVFLSLSLGFFASIVSTFMAVLASLKQTKSALVNVLVASSIAISVITLAFGYFLGFGSGELWVIVAGHSVLAFPFAFRVVNNAMGKIDDESVDAAKTLGASGLEILRRIQLPRIKSALLVAFAFAFAISLGELGLVLVLYDGVYATMPVYVYRLITTYDLSAAGAMGFLLVSISFLVFYVIEHFPGEARVF